MRLSADDVREKENLLQLSLGSEPEDAQRPSHDPRDSAASFN